LRRAKAIFPLIGTGEVVAGIAGGLLVPWLAPRLGAHNLLFLAALALTLAVVVVVLLKPRSVSTEDSGEMPNESGTRRLEATGAPEVIILTATGQIAFRGAAWSAALPDIAIFDSTFVHSNVFAGDYVDHDHRRNLYRVIVGEQGATLSKAVDVLDAQSRDAQKDLTSKKAALV